MENFSTAHEFHSTGEDTIVFVYIIVTAKVLLCLYNQKHIA